MQRIDSTEETIEKRLKTLAYSLARQMHECMRERDIHNGIAYTSVGAGS